jgi:DNA-binding Lrp family transcriptional regulator
MDQLDVKILRALLSERAVAPSNAQVSSSLRSIASRLKTDDATVRYRYKRLEESGFLSGWQLLVNPAFFGYKMLDVTVDVQPESGKEDMIRKLKLIQEIAAIYDFYGRAMKIAVMYGGEDSRFRTVELISRITNTETMTQIKWALPRSRTERLSETDAAIIRALSRDARRSSVQVAKELGLSPRTVGNRVVRLREENTVFAVPVLNTMSIPGLIPVFLSFTYSNNETKDEVDRAMVSHFTDSYLSVEFADPSNGSIFLSASTVTDLRECLEWAKFQPGVASARADILTKSMMFPEKRSEFLGLRQEGVPIQRKEFS